MKIVIKRLLLLSLSIIFFTCFLKPVNATELPDGETYLYSTKEGVPTKVYHYGTGSPVTIPSDYSQVTAEMRGVWVATVYNIAISKQAGTTKSAIQAYKNEFLTILDRMESFGMNTIFFQIRPSNDAFYKSNLNPWSQFLVAPGVDPGWDPLAWMIDETHKRGFDFHCWLNAYRVTTESILPDGSKKASFYTLEQLKSFKEQALAKLADGNFAKMHPEYVVMGESDTRLILNPSEVAVQDFIVESLKEIIENYDIDGMHFDDYFYLNGDVSSDKVNTNFAGGETFNSSLTGSGILNDLGNYQEYLNNNSKYAHMPRGYNLGDFRRENVNVMMRKIRAMVDEYNQKNDDCVEFGSKPAAVWRSNSEYCNGSSRCSEIGSNTAVEAYSSYSDLFADTWKWVEEGLVDYVAPQVYYAFEDKYAPYADVVDWWAKMVDELNAKRKKDNLKEIKLYIAHGIYKYRDASSQFYNAGEIRNQIVYNQKYDSIKGSAVYSYENLYIYTSEVHEKGINYLKNNWSKNLTYPLPHGKDDSAGLRVDSYKVSKDTIDNTVKITFRKIERGRVYGLYKVPKGTSFDDSNVSTRTLIKYSPYQENQNETLDITDYDENYDYYLKVVSSNGYVSKETTKIDFSNMEVFQSIRLYDLSPLSYEVLCGENVLTCLKVDNPLNKTLTYKAWYFENGKNKHRIISQGEVLNNQISFNFKAYSYATTNSSFKIEVTDGNKTISIDTNQFNIVNQRTIPFVDNTEKLSDKYLPTIAIPFNFTLNNPSSSDFYYQIKLVNELTLDSISLDDAIVGTSSNLTINNNFLISEVGNYHFVLLITQDSKTNYYQTSSFEVSTPNFLDSVNMTITFNEVEANISVNLPSNCRNQRYQFVVVDEQDNTIFLIDRGIVNSPNLSTFWYIGDATYQKVRVKLIIGDDTWYDSIYSERITKNISEENPNQPIVPPLIEEEPPKKGCNCKKNISKLITSMVTLLGLIVVGRKRR